MSSPADSDGDGTDGIFPPYDPDAILADPDAHPLHKVYAAINIRIRDHGEQWSKCPNCGNPYQLTEEWSDPTVCSPECHDAYAAYVTAEAAAMPEFLYDLPDPRADD